MNAIKELIKGLHKCLEAEKDERIRSTKEVNALILKKDIKFKKDLEGPISNAKINSISNLIRASRKHKAQLERNVKALLGELSKM